MYVYTFLITNVIVEINIDFYHKVACGKVKISFKDCMSHQPGAK